MTADRSLLVFVATMSIVLAGGVLTAKGFRAWASLRARPRKPAPTPPPADPDDEATLIRIRFPWTPEGGAK